MYGGGSPGFFLLGSLPGTMMQGEETSPRFNFLSQKRFFGDAVLGIGPRVFTLGYVTLFFFFLLVNFEIGSC